MALHMAHQRGLVVMVVAWVGVAGTVGRVGVLYCAQEVECAVCGCGSHPDCWCDHFDGCTCSCEDGRGVKGVEGEVEEKWKVGVGEPGVDCGGFCGLRRVGVPAEVAQ